MRRQQAGPDAGRSQLAPQQVQSQAALAHTREAQCSSLGVPRSASGSTFDRRVMLRGLADEATRACAAYGVAIRRALGHHSFASSNFRAAERFRDDQPAVAQVIGEHDVVARREARQQHTAVGHGLSAISRLRCESGLQCRSSF
jgi:hypothetical protein